MISDHFWLTDAQFGKLPPLLPTDTRGKPPVDDRRVISGIVHVLKSGMRWVDVPENIYGPRKCSTIGSYAGPTRVFGPRFSVLWRKPAVYHPIF